MGKISFGVVDQIPAGKLSKECKISVDFTGTSKYVKTLMVHTPLELLAVLCTFGR